MKIPTSNTFELILNAIKRRTWQPSGHALLQLDKRGILISDVIVGTFLAEIVEDYPEDMRGPSVLILLKDGGGLPVHAHWGIGNGVDFVSLVTAYRPDREKWSDDFLRRKK